MTYLMHFATIRPILLCGYWLARLQALSDPISWRVYVSVCLSVCLSATLMLNSAETKRFRSLWPIGTI